MRNVKGPGGFDVLFYDGVRGVQGPGGLNDLFYDGMRSVKGPGGFDGLCPGAWGVQRPIL